MSGSKELRTIGLVAVLALGVCVSSLAQTYRIEMGWNGKIGNFERRTRSSEHPLQYYLSTLRQNEFLRAETDNCAFASVCRDLSVDLSDKQIGAPFGKKIFQIVYTLKTKSEDGGNWSNRSYWKSIVAQSSPGMYREIFLLKNEGAFWSWPPSTAGMVSIGDTKLLSTKDATTSRDMWCTGAFWVLEKSGPVPADFSAVKLAIDHALPAGTYAVTPLCAAVNLERLEARVEVQDKNAECRACGFEGSVTAKFKFEGSRAVSTSATFLRDARRQ